MNATGREYWVSAARSTRAAWGDALDLRGLPSNVMAGVSTALVAVPVNVALALAGVGLWTGAVAGVVGAVLGGAKLQVTGPRSRESSLAQGWTPSRRCQRRRERHDVTT